MRLMKLIKFETVRIHFLSEFSVCCHPEILLPWERDVTTSLVYIMGNIMRPWRFWKFRASRTRTPASENRAFSHDFTSAILVFQNNETAAVLVSLWFLNLFLTLKRALFFAPMDLHSCWPRILGFHLVLYDGRMIPLAFSLVVWDSWWPHDTISLKLSCKGLVDKSDSTGKMFEIDSW